MHSADDLAQAKREIKAILIEKALAKQNITYSVLAANINSCHLEHDSPELHGILGEISEQEYQNKRGMLSVLVVRKDNNFPGKGFFTCAQGLGYDIDIPKQEKSYPPELKERHKNFCNEMKKNIINYYSNPKLRMKIMAAVKNHNNIRSALDILEADGLI